MIKIFMLAINFQIYKLISLRFHLWCVPYAQYYCTVDCRATVFKPQISFQVRRLSVFN